MVKTLSIPVQLTVREFVQVRYHLYYRRLPLKIATGLGCFLLVSSFVVMSADRAFPWLPLFFGLYLTAGMRFFIYYGAKRAWRTNSKWKETIVYEINRKAVQITGESFHFLYTWDRIQSVAESKEFFLLFYDPLEPYVLVKREMNDVQIGELKEIVGGHRSVGNNFTKPRTARL